VLLRGAARGSQLSLGLNDPEVSRLHTAWDRAAEREQRQRAYFGQHGISPDEVASEMTAADPVLGDAEAVRRFISNAAQRFGGELREARAERRGLRTEGATDQPSATLYELLPGELEGRLHDLTLGAGFVGAGFKPAHAGWDAGPLRVTFEASRERSVPLLGRTHPIVAAFCDAVLGAALDASSPGGDERFPRCGAIATRAVTRRTAVLLLRFRYLLREAAEQYAEEIVLAAFERRDGVLLWLEPFESAGRDLIETARPAVNLDSGERVAQVRWALEQLESDERWFEPIVAARVRALVASQRRLRRLVNAAPLAVLPHKPPDVLGCYVLIPAGG
jgi:hypothetical protein